ncbi:LysR family transcriptional regulator [Asticcacaulis sp. BYS171W]|uniref:LysR family transcriptional regulator n=1 Tax=Asticcacaulis aquaticus TaxID=2984212 RepID=A0ABT5HY83_9CAUL|nr:LysR family transcriptional regulator [Asticcacaulis aquaticus]MDC7685018.1 LysR family transcriptional regulator [Asticcacaulis aquaticus]
MDRALLQFLSVADAGSLSLAAERLRVTQPTLTFNLKKLETSLGVELFERTPRGMRLTSYGQTLYEHGVVMKRLHDNALTSIARQRKDMDYGLSLGSGYTAWTAFLRTFIFDYRTQHPDVAIHVSIGNVLRLMDQLLAGDIVAFVGHKVPDLDPSLGTDFSPVGHLRDGYFVRAGHPLLGQIRTLAELRAYPSTLAFPKESHQRRFSNSVFTGGTVGKAFTSDSLEACLDYVKQTDAVLQHGDLMANEFARLGVHQVHLVQDDMSDPVRMGVYSLKERSNDPRAQALISEFKRRAAQAYGQPEASA